MEFQALGDQPKAGIVGPLRGLWSNRYRTLRLPVALSLVNNSSMTSPQADSSRLCVGSSRGNVCVCMKFSVCGILYISQCGGRGQYGRL